MKDKLTEDDRAFIKTYGFTLAEKVGEAITALGEDPEPMMRDKLFMMAMINMAASVGFARDMVAEREIIPPLLEVLGDGEQSTIVAMTDALSSDPKKRAGMLLAIPAIAKDMNARYVTVVREAWSAQPKSKEEAMRLMDGGLADKPEAISIVAIDMAMEGFQCMIRIRIDEGEDRKLDTDDVKVLICKLYGTEHVQRRAIANIWPDENTPSMKDLGFAELVEA